MRISIGKVVFAVALVAGAAVTRADVWDVGTDNDNSSTSDNELVNGLGQVHDMAAQQGGTVADVDWYPFRPHCNNSFEVLLDGITGALGNANTNSPKLELLADNVAVAEQAIDVGRHNVIKIA